MITARTDVGTVADLHASATRVTGLDDFGDDDYGEGLRVLLESYAAEAALNLSDSRDHAHRVQNIGSRLLRVIALCDCENEPVAF